MSVQGKLPIDEFSVERTALEVEVAMATDLAALDAAVEREEVLRTAAMLTLADSIESRVGYNLRGNAAVRLTGAEWNLIIDALRIAGER